MDLYFELFLVILTLCTMISDAADVTDLQIVCGYVSGTTIINWIPSECTTVAIPIDNRNNMDAINSIRGDIPLMVFASQNSYDNDFFDNCNKDRIDIITFKFEYKDSTWAKTTINALTKMATDAKKKYKNMLVGVYISKDIDSVKNMMDISLIVKQLDFFIVGTRDYDVCQHTANQYDMEPTCKLIDIMRTVDTLSGLKVDMSKIMITIPVLVNTRLNDKTEDITFNKLCTKKIDQDRIACYDSPRQFFEKARYSRIQGMVGIYVSDMESGDPFGECGCQINDETQSYEFPPVRIISGAFKDESTTVNSLSCIYGIFPKIYNY